MSGPLRFPASLEVMQRIARFGSGRRSFEGLEKPRWTAARLRAVEGAAALCGLDNHLDKRLDNHLGDPVPRHTRRLVPPVPAGRAA